MVGNVESEEEEEEEMFRKGSRVEVSINDEGFTGAWYLATVLQTPSSSSSTGTHNMYFVEYDNLLCDDDTSKPLSEYVDVSFMRPQPPAVADDDGGGNYYGFTVGDVVDLNLRDGWWTGVVKEVVDGGFKFVVCFQNPTEEIECNGSDIRLHLHWVDRKWVRPDNQGLVVPSSGDQKKTGSLNGEGDSSSDMMDIQHGSFDAATDNNKPNDANLDMDVTLRSLKRSKAGNTVEEQPPCQLESKEQAFGKQKSGSTEYKRRRRRGGKKSHVKRSHASAKGDKGNQLRFNTGEVLDKEGGEVAEKEGVEDVVFAMETESEAQNLHQLPEKASVESVRDQDPKARELGKIITESNVSMDEESHIRKKRGRPQKSLGKILEGAMEGEKHDVAVGVLNQKVVKNVAPRAVHYPNRLRKGIFWSDSFNDFPSWISNKECFKLIATSKRFLSGARRSESRRKLGESKYEQLNFMVAENRAEQSASLLLEEHRDKTTSDNNGTPSQDPQNASSGKSSEVCNTSDSEARDATDVINDEIPGDIFDDGALLTPNNGVKSTAEMNNGVSSGRALESSVLDESSGNGQDHTAMQTQSLAVVVNSKSVEESQNLPFAKCSPVWKTIESLDVFQKTPQRPHFSPLVKCRENCREGLAVGHMITFANLVERTLNLQLSHPQILIESSFETLRELEDHGFEVDAVRNRLTELECLKAKVGELEDSSKEAEREIKKLNVEKKAIEELLDRVETKMRQIKEKIGAAASMKETKVKQIDLLQSKVNFFADSVENAKRDFGKIAASPL